MGEKFNCTKKCVPLIYDSLMNVIDHNIPKCTDPIKNDECMLGMKGYETREDLKSTCIKQCKFKGATLDLTLIKQKPIFPLGKVQISLFLAVTPEQIIYKEYLVYDAIGMIGSIGGSLGLCIGVSVFDTLCMFVDVA